MLPADMTLIADPDVSEVRGLLDRSVKLNHRGLFLTLLKDGERPKEWATNAHLRHARLVRLDGRNQGSIGDYVLTVNGKLGVVIEKEGGNNG